MEILLGAAPMLGATAIMLGAGALALAAEKAIKYGLMKLFYPERQPRLSGKVEKQALLLDTAKLDAWKSDLSFSVAGGLAAACATLTIGAPLFALPVGVMVFAASNILSHLVVDTICLRSAHKTHRLAKALRKKGYVVNISHNENADWSGLVDRLYSGATGETVSVVSVSCHGGMGGKGIVPYHATYTHYFNSEYWSSERSTTLSIDHIRDYELVALLSVVPGKKVLLVDACKAGGFAKAAENLSSDKLRDNIAVLTSSGEKVCLDSNPLSRSFRRYVSTSTSGSVSDFFSEHSRKYANTKRPLFYKPASFTGKNMQIRL